MKESGFWYTLEGILITFGLITMIISFFLDTTVSNTGSMFNNSGGTYNIGLMQRQMMVLYVGIVLTFIGLVLFAVNTLKDKFDILISQTKKIEPKSVLSSDKLDEKGIV